MYPGVTRLPTVVERLKFTVGGAGGATATVDENGVPYTVPEPVTITYEVTDAGNTTGGAGEGTEGGSASGSGGSAGGSN